MVGDCYFMVFVVFRRILNFERGRTPTEKPGGKRGSVTGIRRCQTAVDVTPMVL